MLDEEQVRLWWSPNCVSASNVILWWIAQLYKKCDYIETSVQS